MENKIKKLKDRQSVKRRESHMHKAISKSLNRIV